VNSMAGETHTLPAKTQRSNRVIAAVCLAFFGGMVGAAYASVPLYKLFCQVTGYGGTTRRVEQYSDKVLDRTITVRFDTNTSGGIPWDFVPVKRDMTMKIGETVEAKFRVTNLFDRPASGRATFNVSPEMAGAYFNKMECFCFTDTTLKAGETLDMPVVFYVDPAIVDVPELRDIRTITLSYTFFPIDGEKPVAAANKPAARKGTDPDSKIGG
jgi:cytochrome c oxidase assembly protein subunit 11